MYINFPPYSLKKLVIIHISVVKLFLFLKKKLISRKFTLQKTTALLSSNSHTIQFSYLKCITQ